MRRGWVAAGSFLLLLASRAVAQDPTPRGDTLDVTLLVRPQRAGGPEIKAVAVREELRGPLDQTSQPLSLRIPISSVGRTGIADRVDDLVVRDAQGEVPLSVANDAANASGYVSYRHWRAIRRVATPVTITYRIRPKLEPSGGPQFEFYAHHGGLNASGQQLFVTPESVKKAVTHVRWDLSDLAPGSIAVATDGKGDFDLDQPPNEMDWRFFLVGPLGHY